KTRPSDESVEDFLKNVENQTRKKDSFEILKIMKEISGFDPILWGNSIIGFGSYHYKYKSGREGDMPLTGFSPRKQNLTLYIMDGFEKKDELLNKLGKHKLGKSCLYINKLDDINIHVLKEIINESLEYMKIKNK
ncbi:unnamed protein product, partial [marine sediment metagenome]